MRKLLAFILVLALLSACGERKSTTIIPVKQEEIPCDVYDLPIRKEIALKDRVPSIIDLRDIKDSIAWIYAPALTDCFGYNNKPRYLSVDSKDKLVSAKMIINYYPTIWSNEDDEVLQLMEFPALKSVGIKDIVIDNGRILQLNDKDLFILPENVKKQIAEITQQDLLSELETSGNAYEYENWAVEKRTWKRYIGEYRSGDFINDIDDSRFGTYPNTFYIQLVFKGKKGDRVINLCDIVIIGN